MDKRTSSIGSSVDLEQQAEEDRAKEFMVKFVGDVFKESLVEIMCWLGVSSINKYQRSACTNR